MSTNNKYLDKQGLETLWDVISSHYTKRNTSYTDSYVPYNGQICFVDTFNNGLKVKIGDGTTQFKNLPYSGNKAAVNTGYYNKTYDCFFMEETETNIIPKDTDVLYYDIPSQQIYFFNGNKYNQLVSIAQVDGNQNGLIKLYSSHGSNIDGTMTQKAITDGISAISLGLDEDDNECIKLLKPW